MDAKLNVTFSLTRPELPQMEGVPTYAPVKVLEKDEVCSQVSMEYGYEVPSCRKYMAITLREDIRKARVTPFIHRVLNDKSEFRSWKVAGYHCVEDEVIDARFWQGILENVDEIIQSKEYLRMTPQALYQNSGHSEKLWLLSDSEAVIDVLVCNPFPDKNFETISVFLPPLKDAPEGKQVVVFFNRPLAKVQEKDLNLVPDQEAKSKAGLPIRSSIALNPTAVERSGISAAASALNLSPQEAAVYVKSNGQWHVKLKMVQRGEELNPNPLLRLSSPLKFNQSSVLQVQSDDGEYFLNQKMITTLYQKKVDDQRRNAQGGNAAEPIQWDYVVSEKALNALSTLDERAKSEGVSLASEATNYAYHFFFERWNSCHTVGLFVQVSGNEVNLYLHETEGCENTTAIKIRAQLRELMRDLYPDKKLHLFFPEAMLQKEFAGCGVFAFKAMNYFRKHPEEMKAWLTVLKETEKVEEAHTEKTQSMDVDDAGEVTSKDEASGYDSRITEHVVPFDKMKPELLKMFNGTINPRHEGAPEFTREQLSGIVSKQKSESLFEYLWKYEADDVPKPDGRKTVVNVGSLKKRYDYFAKFEACKNSGQDEEGLDHSESSEHEPIVMRIGRKRRRIAHGRLAYPAFIKSFTLEPPRKVTKEELAEQFHGAPKDVLGSCSRERVNQWLSEFDSELFTKSEWKYIMKYYAFCSEEADFRTFRKQSPKAGEWLQYALGQPQTHPKYFLVHHWFMDGMFGLHDDFMDES